MNEEGTKVAGSSLGSLSMRERLAYGAGSMGTFMASTIISGFLMFFYSDQLSLNIGIIGTLMLVSRVFDGVSDLAMGAIVDKTKSKHGKARCWILWLCIPNAIAAILLFALQGSWPDVVKYVYVFITYNLVNTIFFTGLIVPYNAMNALMTKNQYERGMLGTVNVIGAVVGQILVNSFMLKIVGFFGNTQSAWIITTSIFAIIGAALHLFCFFGTKERTSEAAKKKEDEPGFVESIKSLLHNKYWLLLTVIGVSNFFVNGILASSTVYFAALVMGDANAVSSLSNALNIAQLIAFLVAFTYIKKFGKGNSYRIGMVIQVIASILKLFCLHNVALFSAVTFIQGIGVGMGSACFAGMISDSIEYGEWKTGVRTVGMSNAAVSFSQKVGMGVGTALVGWVLSAVGYVATAATQPASVVTGISVLYVYLPLAFGILNLILINFYKLDKEYPQIIADLEARNRK